MADLENAEQLTRKAVQAAAPRTLTRAELARQEQESEDAALKRRRNPFGQAGFTFATDGSDFAAVDADMVNHSVVASGDWGGCGSDDRTPEEVAWDRVHVFDQIFEASYLDHWSDYESDYVSPVSHFYTHGSLNMDDPYTQYMVGNSTIVNDDDGNAIYIDTGSSCVNPNTEFGTALIDAKRQMDYDANAEAAAETPLDISDPEVAARVRGAEYLDDGTISFNGQCVDANSVAGLRIIQANDYLDAMDRLETRMANAEIAAETPLDVTDPEVAARVQATTITPDSVITENACLNPDSVEAQRLTAAHAELTGEGEPALAGPPSPEKIEPAAPAQGGDVAAVYTATGEKPVEPAKPEVEAVEPDAAPKAQTAEFDELMAKFELDPSKVLKPAAPAPAPTPAPQLDHAM